MIDPTDPNFELRLQALERQLNREGKPRQETVRGTQRLLRTAHTDLFQRSRNRAPRELHDAFHQLMERAARAATSQELRDVLGDLRQYLFSFTSAARAHELETKLRELENQLAASARTAAEMPEPSVDDDKVLTIDSLKGKRVLFAIMPFHPDFEDIWIGGIHRAASGTGLTPIRIDMITSSSEITNEIVAAIQMSEIVVVDVTGNNPNVMFEFGFALALKKRQVVISQSTEFLTFDIKNVRTLIYKNTWQGIETLHKDLQRFIKGALGTKPQKSKKTAKTSAKAK